MAAATIGIDLGKSSCNLTEGDREAQQCCAVTYCAAGLSRVSPGNCRWKRRNCSLSSTHCPCAGRRCRRPAVDEGFRICS
jgi:hypothetical protein